VIKWEELARTVLISAHTRETLALHRYIKVQREKERESE